MSEEPQEVKEEPQEVKEEARLESLIGEIFINEKKFRKKGYVSYEDDSIVVKIYFKNENKKTIYLAQDRIGNEMTCEGWIICGKDGMGNDGKFVGKKLGSLDKIKGKKWLKIEGGKKGKVEGDLIAIMNKYTFEEEGKIDVKYDSMVEYCEDPKATPRVYGKIRVRTNCVQILSKEPK